VEPSLRAEKWKCDQYLHPGRQGPLGRLYLGFRRGAWDCPDDPDCHWGYPHCSAVTFDWPLGNLDRRKCYHHVLSRKVRHILILNFLFFPFLKETEAVSRARIISLSACFRRQLPSSQLLDEFLGIVSANLLIAPIARDARKQRNSTVTSTTSLL